MDVRTEGETAEGGRKGLGRGGGGGCVLEISEQTDRRACVRGRRAGKRTGPDRACPPGDLPTPTHLTDRVIIKLHAS